MRQSESPDPTVGPLGAPIDRLYGSGARSGLLAPAANRHHESMSATALHHPTGTAPTANVWPGILLATIGAGIATIASRFLPISSLTLALLIGAGWAALTSTRPAIAHTARPGMQLAARRILRIGVVLLGLRLSVTDIAALGWTVVAIVATTVAITFFGTRRLGHAMGVPPGLALLVATGWSICGASAIAAMSPVARTKDDESATAIGLVAIAGTIVMIGLPALGAAIGLGDQAYGIWAGASIHDVAQVVGAASVRGDAVLAIAVVVKLTRVVLLAPLLAGVAATQRRAATTGDATGHIDAPLIPGFVLGFLALMLIRTSGVVPTDILDIAIVAEKLAFTVALVGLGSAITVRGLRSIGRAPIHLAIASTLLVAATSLAAIGLLAALNQLPT